MVDDGDNYSDENLDKNLKNINKDKISDDKKYFEKNTFIRNYKIILTYFFSGIFALIVIVLIILLLLGNIKISIEDFRYTDFLSVILALFAILISLLFYLKTNEINNRFYKDVNDFIKDVSYMLGEMKGLFSEKLGYLDEHYSNMDINLSKIKEELIQEKTTTEEEIEKVTEDYAKKFKISPNDLESYNETIREKNTRILELEESLNELKTQSNIFKTIRLGEGIKIPSGTFTVGNKETYPPYGKIITVSTKNLDTQSDKKNKNILLNDKDDTNREED